MNVYPPDENGHLTVDQPDLSALESPIRLSNPGEVACLVPYLLGFHPTSSVVVLAFVDSRLVVTARFDLACCSDVARLGERLGQIDRHFPAAEYVLAGYADDRAAAEQALSMVEYLLGLERVIDSLYVTADRFWSRLCTRDDCCPAEGRRYDANCSPAAVQAVIAGLQALPNRADLARRVQSPRGGAARAARRSIDLAHAMTCTRSDDELTRIIDDLLDQGLAAPETLRRDDLSMLSVLLDRPGLRDRALGRLTRESGEANLVLWERLVRATPRAEQGPALGLMGLAAWVSGHGALQTICIERAEESHLGHPLVQIVATIQQMAVPPALWEQLRQELFGGLAGPCHDRP